MAPSRSPGIGDLTRRRLLEAAAIAVLAAAVLHFALAARTGILGGNVDDAYYGIMAKALAAGQPDALPDFGGQPRHGRFPLGYPALLALVLRAIPDLPSAVAAWEVLSALAATSFAVAMYFALTRAWSLPRGPAFAAVALASLHPVAIRLAASVMSDYWGALLALGGLAAVQQALAGRDRRGAAAVPALAAAILMRLASGGVALAVGAGALWAAGRRRAAAWLLGGTALLLAPYFWVFGARHFRGYADDFAVNGAGLASWPGALARSAWLLLAQTLPGLGVPSLFLPGAGYSLVSASGPDLPPALAWAGAAAGLLVLASLGAAFARPGARLAAAFAAADLVLVVVWTAPYGAMGWELQTRLLLPVAPFLLAFGIRELAGRAGALGRRVLFPAALVVLVAATLSLARREAAFSSEAADTEAAIPRITGYLQAIPPSVRLGAFDPYMLAFYSGRIAMQVSPSAEGLKAARRAGVRLLIIQPLFIGGMDVVLIVRPPARTLFTPSAHWAVVQLR